VNDASMRDSEFSTCELRVRNGHMDASCVLCCYYAACTAYAWPIHRVSSGLKLLLTLPYAVFGPPDVFL